ncbi:MAG TPA: baseplate J/gp47 family protein [Pseudolabrys sp.]|nr:baseplate J/gp47 family protein [Pseudolabrys sp.]
MASEPICPCDGAPDEQTISNPPARASIAYRVGDFRSFRHALLKAAGEPFPEEQQLANWRPSAEADLGVQMLEWWAYLADILTFYNERIANESYLRTATRPENLRRLIRTLGYRPRPGIAAHGTLAALVGGHDAVTLPRGFAVDSKPGPGEQPQTFELDADTSVTPEGTIPADPPAFAFAPDNSFFLLAGTKSSLKAGAAVMLDSPAAGFTPQLLVLDDVTIDTAADGIARTKCSFAAYGATAVQTIVMQPVYTQTMQAMSGYNIYSAANAPYKMQLLQSSAQMAQVAQQASQMSPSPQFAQMSLSSQMAQLGTQLGATVVSTAAGQVPTDTPARDLMVLQPTQSSPLSTIDNSAFSSGAVHLAGLARDLHAGDYVLFTAPGRTPALRQLASVTEVLWYANHKTGTGNGPATPPDLPTVAIAIMHSLLVLADALPSNWPTAPGSTTVRYGWRSAGELVDQPVITYSGAPATLDAHAPATFPANKHATILIAGSTAGGMVASGYSSDGKSLTLTDLDDPPPALRTPLTVHFNLLDVSRGKTVPSEVLGNGDASVAGQSFVLKKSPLTYKAKGDSFESTLQVWVNGRLWQEAASFFGQSADAEIFVTREDDAQKTTVTFGDGVNGARLPTGVNNIVASYRYGSGAKSPAAGALTVIDKPYPNLKSLKNPVAVGGGADPDPPEQIRKLAPRSVMTFGRAISGDDYLAIAAQAPGVTRAQAVWAFDTNEQRSAVTLYVGDDKGALDSATAAIAATGDPHRHVIVKPATPVAITLSLTLLVDPRYILDDVKAAARVALIDDDAGLFGARRLGIGEAVYDSQICEACLACDGAVAVHDIRFAINQFRDFNERHAPGEGAFYQLDSFALTINPEVAQYAG